MGTDSFSEDRGAQTLSQAFPDVEPNVVPLGGRVLVQLMRIARKTSGGLILVEETAEIKKWNNQVARVTALGPLAFRNRETQELWPEGEWVRPGDYVRVPRWNGDRIEVKVKDEDPIIFVVFNDHEIITKVLGDPLSQRTYIL